MMLVSLAPSVVLVKGIDLHHSIRRSMFRDHFRMSWSTFDSPSKQTSNAQVDRASALKQTNSLEEATALIVQWFSSKFSQVLGLRPDDVDKTRPANVYGIDSLVEIDLKNWIKGRLAPRWRYLPR